MGIAGGLLFVAWFASGIVMMYHRMPSVTPEEQWSHAEPLGLATLRVTRLRLREIDPSRVLRVIRDLS